MRTELTRAEREVDRAGFLRAFAVAQPGAAPAPPAPVPPVDEPVDQLAEYNDDQPAPHPAATEAAVVGGTGGGAADDGAGPANGDGSLQSREGGDRPADLNAGALPDSRVQDLEGAARLRGVGPRSA